MSSMTSDTGSRQSRRTEDAESEKVRAVLAGFERVFELDRFAGRRTHDGWYERLCAFRDLGRGTLSRLALPDALLRSSKVHPVNSNMRKSGGSPITSPLTTSRA